MSYALIMSRQARSYVARLDATTQARVGSALRELQENPLHHGTKLLKGQSGFRPARVGSLRIIYTVAADPAAVEIRVIAPRGQVYRRL